MKCIETTKKFYKKFRYKESVTNNKKFYPYWKNYFANFFCLVVGGVVCSSAYIFRKKI